MLVVSPLVALMKNQVDMYMWEALCSSLLEQFGFDTPHIAIHQSPASEIHCTIFIASHDSKILSCKPWDKHCMLVSPDPMQA